jgi:hypothetical protein
MILLDTNIVSEPLKAAGLAVINPWTWQAHCRPAGKYIVLDRRIAMPKLQQTMALLEILKLGKQQIERGEVHSAESVFTELDADMAYVDAVPAMPE